MFILKAENTEKVGHNAKPRLPGKMCTLTSVVRSQHATVKTKRICIPRTSISEYNKAISGVFIQRTGLCYTEHSSCKCICFKSYAKFLLTTMALHLFREKSSHKR